MGGGASLHVCPLDSPGAAGGLPGGQGPGDGRDETVWLCPPGGKHRLDEEHPCRLLDEAEGVGEGAGQVQPPGAQSVHLEAELQPPLLLQLRDLADDLAGLSEAKTQSPDWMIPPSLRASYSINFYKKKKVYIVFVFCIKWLTILRSP